MPGVLAVISSEHSARSVCPRIFYSTRNQHSNRAAMVLRLRLLEELRLINPNKPSSVFNRHIRSASSINLSPSSDSSISLLPPLVLYRRLLRIHRDLPVEMRSLGDLYVKDEFRRCRSIDNPIQIIGFLSQWKLYLDNLIQRDTHHQQHDSSSAVANHRKPSVKIGKKLPEDLLEKLSPEQVGQLFELLKATKEIWVDVDNNNNNNNQDPKP
ncbi:acetate non-utilizing protein 9 [Puccinia graminis f. sp. tritici]|uniref:Succinate dehydrogenase assembly factor 3 n=1 Tax=Puccinia graminis f. sp. tritici TaxID=56615 RepID=A0A5B0QIL3_PUCGR|nr:acetate non-utilizing protein 9 [Puccinia graminis f. sp. tritici]